MKPLPNRDQERYSGPVCGLRTYQPMPSHAGQQAPRPAAVVPAKGRWLATLNANLDEVREAILVTLSDLPAELAYLYHADEKVVIRAIHDEYQVRVEILPLEAQSTRVMVECTLDGQLDRAMSTRIVRSIEDRLTSAHS